MSTWSRRCRGRSARARRRLTTSPPSSPPTALERGLRLGPEAHPNRGSQVVALVAAEAGSAGRLGLVGGELAELVDRAKLKLAEPALDPGAIDLAATRQAPRHTGAEFRSGLRLGALQLAGDREQGGASDRHAEFGALAGGRLGARLEQVEAVGAGRARSGRL